MTNGRTVTQIVDGSGAPQRAHEQPGWFLTNGDDKLGEVFGGNSVVRPPAMPAWSEMFAQPRPGHDVEFFVDGSDYFKKVAEAIRGATQSVFITGWQINYAVQMGDGTTLLNCLDTAVEKGVHVYVMPWLAPPGPIDTGYLHTMLAVLHLNGGTPSGMLRIMTKSRKGRAFCLPAVGQSDMSGLNAFFSHHQKLVVVDNIKAFVGGIDLAYGRREDGSYNLEAGTRSLCEYYSPNVPAIKEPTAVELDGTLPLIELLINGIVPWPFRRGLAFPFTPADGMLARGVDRAGNIANWMGERLDGVKDFVNRRSPLDGVPDAIAEAGEEAAIEAAEWLWSQLPSARRNELRGLYRDSGALFQEAVQLIWDILQGIDASRLPYRKEVFELANEAINALVGVLVSVLTDKMNDLRRWDRVFDSPRQHPGASRIVDPQQQPRQPWHDVHCGLQGPAVHDLSRNFTQRWDAAAKGYREGLSRYRNNKLASYFLRLFDIATPTRANVPNIDPRHVSRRPSTGSPANQNCWVQVLRSAPTKLLKAEQAVGATQAVQPHQNNCLKAMLKAIHGAQQFIYIEGQFFQSNYAGFADDKEPGQPLSGPAGAMVSVEGLEDYERYAEMLGIKGKPINAINPSEVRWGNAGKVMRDPRYEAFQHSLRRIIDNHTTLTAMELMDQAAGTRQHALVNPISKALAARIERAIQEDQPFHVYLVVPVHPEGMMDQITIMRQIDLTMHTLVHGPQSLVNCVRRALVARHEQDNNGLSEADALEKARNLLLERLLEHEAGERWMDYVTLLNLRSHAVMNGRPVTEQVYVHSKLLIADDRVAVLGSANINDRSMLGMRDSELAVIVAGGPPAQARLDGENISAVSARVQGFRQSLWKRIFGEKASGGIRPAAELLTADILQQPAALRTIKLVQAVAERNASAYETAFAFVPRSAPPSWVALGAKDKTAALWPTWCYPEDWWNEGREGRVGNRGHLAYRMPFDPLFWRPAARSDDGGQLSWNVAYDAKDRPEGVAGIAPETSPRRVQGFITALPVGWAARESNDTGFALSVLANNDAPNDQGAQGDVQVAQTKTMPELPSA